MMAPIILAQLPNFTLDVIMRYLLGCALLVFSAHLAYSQVPALSFTGSTPSGAAISSTRGYIFSVTSLSGVNVSGLSFYDAGADGLNDSHDVGLWDSSGNLLASATVPSGTFAALDTNGLFRVVNIPNVFLPQGNNYRVGAVFEAGSADAQANALVGISTPSQIQYVAGAIINNGLTTLTFPSTNFASGLPGGSFEIAAVPEPAAIALLALVGGSGVAVWYRRRRRLKKAVEAEVHAPETCEEVASSATT